MGPASRKKRYPSCVLWSKRASPFVVGSGRGLPKDDRKLNACGRKKAPLWWKSSPMNQSAMGAWGEVATSAGCASIVPMLA